MLQAILFDLDGALLPMDNDRFVKEYFGYLAEEAAKWGYTDTKLLVKTIWDGVAAMVKNDGSCSNAEAFWACFSIAYHKDLYEDMPRFDSFYANEFHKARNIVVRNGLERRAVETARGKAEHVILATNPIFPMVADRSRLSWIDLKPEDFDLVTDYENCCHSKPNPEYYRDILQQFGLDPKECLMVGNDVDEDAVAAGAAGIPCFLITDFMINRKGREIPCPHGTFEEMIRFLEAL